MLTPSYLSILLVFILGLTPSTLFASKDSLIQIIIEEADLIRSDGQNVQAIKVLNKALKKYKSDQSIPDSSLAKLYHKLSINYFYSNQFNEAYIAANTAVILRQSALKKGHPDLANSQYIRGVINSYKGNYEQSKKDINAAIVTFEQNTSLPSTVVDSILAGYYITMGNVSSELGDLYQSILFWDRSQQYYLQRYGPQHWKYAFLHDRKGTAYHDLKRYNQALNHLTKALDIFQSMGAETDPENLAIVYTNLSRTSLELGKPQQAKSYALKALAINQQLDNSTEICNLYANLIEIYRQLRDYEAANRAFNRGLKLAEQVYETTYHPILSELHINQGKVKLDQQNYSSALQLFQESIGALVPNLNPASIDQNPSLALDFIEKKADLIDPLILKANTLFERYNVHNDPADLALAQKTYQVLDSVVMQVRQSLQTGESKYALHSRLVPAYENGILSALRLFELGQDSTFLETAYSFAARNKAIILLEGRQDEKAKLESGIPDSLLSYEKTLERQYYEIERDLYDLNKTGDRVAFQNKKQELFQLKRAYDRYVENIEQHYPDYHHQKYALISVPQSQDIRRELDSDRAVIEFFVGSREIFLFILTQSTFNYHRIKKPANFSQTCFNFRSSLTADQANSEMIQNYTESALQLYQWLLQDPLMSLPENITRLTIIPDDILLQVSFDVLLTNQAEDWRGAQKPYLMQDYAISYAYSNKLIFESSQNNHLLSGRQRFAGFGLEYNNYTLEGLSQLDTVNQDRGLSRALRSVGKLLYSDDEVLEISSLLKGQVWVNQEATKQTFIDQAHLYGILHLAMHGIVDEDQPMNSALIFSRTSDSLDYFLYASDIYNLQLPRTKMVVLSACNTGYGQLTRGEGVRSLVRAFAYAGSPSLVATLWSAPDKPTKDIMLQFYAKLKTGLPKDVALQQAKLDYLQQSSQEYTAPPYWAHLIVAGEVAPIFRNSGLSGYYWWLIGFGLILGFFFAKKSALGGS